MLNITNRTPLAGVKLFESSTYPADSIDLYWRDKSPIVFELSDNPDRGQMYQNLLARIQSEVSAVNIQYFQQDESRLITAELRLHNSPFWVIMDYDVITLYRCKPTLPSGYEEKPEELCNMLVDVFLMNVEEALLATSFSPVDLAWLIGAEGNFIGMYCKEIWHAAGRRMPGRSFFSFHWDDRWSFDAPEVVADHCHPCRAQ